MRGIEELVNPDRPGRGPRDVRWDHGVKRYGMPEEIAELVLFLLSDRAAYITGTAVSIDGGVMTGVG